ncbi:MAG TPA: glycerophosphodiester phosphodiesterase family protein [Candidatus Methylomirabilis sp.]|nr:glycerophosphodiester phosphodiesterase family protein [Candidatus Methylomirabilis sp.]
MKFVVAHIALVWMAAAAPVLAQGAAFLVAAHRGGGLLWPENSLLAFRNAIDLGADYIEFDVHLSRDGEVVVIHDPTLDRTTTGAGTVGERTLAELRTLRLKDRAGTVTEELVPTLDEVAAVAAGGKRRMLLEIKTDAQRRRYSLIEEKVIAILDRHGMSASTVVMAFERETWQRIRRLRPDITSGSLYSRNTLSAMGSTATREIEASREAGVGVVGLHHSLVDEHTVAAARRAGVTLGVWTVNEPETLRRVLDLGVAIVITDRPDLARGLLHR